MGNVEVEGVGWVVEVGVDGENEDVVVDRVEDGGLEVVRWGNGFVGVEDEGMVR